MNSLLPSVTVGNPTSFDIARHQRQKYTIETTSKVKRPDERIYLRARASPNHQVHGQALGIITAHGFKRPRVESSTSDGKRLSASKIENSFSSEKDAPSISIYSQRRALPSTPRVSQNPLLSLSHPAYGLPARLTENFSALGINSIYPWQSSCLLSRGLLTAEKNLVYTAPTGGGKSLVADVLMLKRVIENKKAILVLPYVALVQEKLKWLRRATEGLQKNSDVSDEPRTQSGLLWRKNSNHRSVRVVGIFGGSNVRATWADIDIAVCTIEKANLLVNTAIEDGTIRDLGLVILDELHMIDDGYRGYLMELMATKLLSMQQAVQIIGMSATLSNTEVLARWLDAKYYESKYKPVPIEEYLVCDNLVYPISSSGAFLNTTSQPDSTQSRIHTVPTRTILPSKHIELAKPMPNSVIALAIETANSGFGVLVFCSSRLACQTTAELVSSAMPTAQELTDEILDRRKEVLTDLRSVPTGLDETLQKTIIRGVAFHHAGLTTEERDIVADAYDRGVLSVIVATCSLAAGINLPARRVVLQGARMGRDLIGPAMLRQMRGRAGRKGKDEIGESYVCCQKEDIEEVSQLLEADLPAVESCLTPEKRGMKRALLEVIAIRIATHQDAIQDYIRRTLLYHTVDHSILSVMVDDTIDSLHTTGLIALNSDKSYEATLLGQAAVASSLTPEDAVFIYRDFQRALQAFVMDGEMHVFYMFTPIQPSSLVDINWVVFRREMDSLDKSSLRVLKYVGVNPAMVNRMANSSKALPETTAQEIETARIYRRFYAAFQLRDLCNEIPIHVVARRFEVPRGFVQTLAQTCDGFAAGMIKFCERMRWGMLRSVLEHMSDRLKAGAKADLLELAKIPFVKSRTARTFWEHGLRNLRAVAESEPRDLVPILILAQPKKSKINGDEEERYKEKLAVKAEIIVGAASGLWEREQQLAIEMDM